MGEKYFLRPVREQDLRILLAWRNSERIHSTMLTGECKIVCVKGLYKSTSVLAY